MSEQNSQSIKSDRISESSIARIAGNIMSGLSAIQTDESGRVQLAVRLARKIAAGVERTKPAPSQGDT